MRCAYRIFSVALLALALACAILCTGMPHAMAEEQTEVTATTADGSDDSADTTADKDSNTKEKEEEPPPPKEYQVYYDPNGGEGAMDASTFIEGKEAKLARCTFTRAGYTFEGWDTAADGSGTRLADAADVRDLLRDEGLTLYAQWGSQIYVIHYSSGVPEQSDSPASGSVESQLAVHDAEVGLAECGFTRVGYTPLRWVDQNGKKYEFGELGTNFASETDTSSWELATIAVNTPIDGKDGHWSCQGSTVFEGEDGSLCAAMAFFFSNTAYSKGSLSDYDSVIKVVNLNTGEELKSARGLMLEHANDIAYRPDNRHFYVAQGGINEGFPDGIVELDEDLNEVRTITPEGTHNIWNLSYSNGRFYAIGNVSGDSFARGNPNGETSDLIVLDEDLNLLETYTVDYSLTGFSGQGMVCDGSFLYSILMNFGEHEAVAKQRLAIFTLEGEPRGTQRIDILSEVESASTLDGRMYFSTNGGDKGTIYGTNLASATMSVVWEPNPYSIRFDRNNFPANTIPDTIQTTYDEEVRLPADVPTCPGYDFVAWTSKPDGGTSYKPGDIVHNLATSGTVTLYAQWQRSGVPFATDNGSMTDASLDDTTALKRLRRTERPAARHMARAVAIVALAACATCGLVFARRAPREGALPLEA